MLARLTIQLFAGANPFSFRGMHSHVAPGVALPQFPVRPPQIFMKESRGRFPGHAAVSSRNRAFIPTAPNLKRVTAENSPVAPTAFRGIRRDVRPSVSRAVPEQGSGGRLGVVSNFPGKVRVPGAAAANTSRTIFEFS
jgi:hypothetical protein